MNGPAALLLCILLGACAGLDGYGSAHAPVGSDGGFSAERLATLTRRAQADIDARRAPGVVLLVVRNGKVVYAEALGVRDPKTGAPMAENSIFRIYSMSKPIVSVGALMLVEDGKLALDDAVSDYLPELKNLKVGVEKIGPDGKPTLELVPAKQEMTVQDLLRNTSGLLYEFEPSSGFGLVRSEYLKAGLTLKKIISNDDLVQKLSHLPLAFQPGTSWEYGRSADVLGALIERISGKPLDVYLSERILEPLKMDDTGFWVEPTKQGRLAEPFEIDPDSKKPTDLIDVRSRPTFLSGAGGMVSTAPDYLRFLQMLLNGGELDGVRILSRKTVQYMTSDHFNGTPGQLFYLVGPGYSFGLGFAIRTATGMAPFVGSVGEYRWLGYAGTVFWVDPRERLIAICMMQSLAGKICDRGLYGNMLYGAIE
ncbi:MAG TPA: serine hydrolase domain-containing protein [Casimicrobiaceae bacterium]|nr:serine hydrolase domain-containing protein [Casimicrobiaceae bacterium]